MAGLYRRYGKRLFDFMASGLGLLVLLPILAILYVLSLIKIGFPAFFTQDRPGLGEKIFKMVKFRTMTNEKGPDGQLLPDDVRLVRYGKILRATSLDELPELWNVFKGDMSLVGPRPLLVRYLGRYNDRQRRRHESRPGITGWAQVNGRNNVPWEDRFEMDVWYVDNCSFGLDLKILWMTVLKVVKRSDVNQEGHATMTEFMGAPTPSETERMSDV